jgi:CheY-like chemotaxis protein
MTKVLVADDSNATRKIAKLSLEQGGYTVVEAADGQQAVALAKTEHPDLILLDAEMPEMDGWEACRTVKDDPVLASIPVYLCTGHDLSEEPEQLTEAKANGYITKPYNPAQLLSLVAEALHG